MKSKFSQMIKAIFAPTKRLMLVLSLLLTISAVYAGPSGSKIYYAKATVAVAGESTGVGLVYVIDNKDQRYPESGGLESTGTNDMSQENNNSFAVKIGAIATDQNYCVKEWKKDGTTVITATGKEMNQNISGQEGSSKITNFVAYFVKQITPNSTELTINAATGTVSTDIMVYNTTSLTVEELSADLAAKFTYTIAFDKNNTWKLTVNSTASAVNGDEVTLTLRNDKGATAQVDVNFVENQEVTFKGSAFGTYRVLQGDAYNRKIEETTNAEPLLITDPDNFVLSFTEITPIEGYRFNRFKLTPEKGTPYYIYDDEQDGNAQSGNIIENTTIEPEFVPTNYAQFIIVGDTSIHYSTLDRAFEKAAELGKTVVAVYQPGTVNVKMNGDGLASAITRPATYKYEWILPKPASGTYTIPAGYTLLVPGLDKNSLTGTKSTTVAKQIGYTYLLGKSTESDYVEVTPSSVCVCKLAVEQGTTIQVNGNISVYSCLSPNQGHTGRPFGYGQIHLENGSRIQVNAGGILHAMGYVTGDPMKSSVVAKSSSKIYEAFQFTDWRGGTAMMAGLVNNEYEVFPVGQYYVQNIETMLEMEYGSMEYLTTAVDVLKPFPVTSEFVTSIPSSGDALGLIALGPDTKVQKYYDGTTDRLKLTILGTTESAKARLSYMYLDVKVLFADYSLDSREYVLPINNNIDVLIDNVELQLPFKFAFMAGSTLTVTKDAKLNIQNKVYVYDKELNTQLKDATKGYYAAGNVPLSPIGYTAYHGKAPGLRTAEKLRYPEKLTDATLTIDGTLTMEGNGALYTTTYSSDITGLTNTNEDELERVFGANITSNGGGVMNFYALGKSSDKVYQLEQGSGTNKTWIQIPICNAWLRNADGSRSGGTDAKEGETYMYSDGKWEVPEADLRNPNGNVFYLTLPKDSTQNVVAEIIEHGGVEITNFSVQLSGTQFALVGNYDGNEFKREGDNLIIPVKYTHTGKHDVANPNTGKISVTITYNDPLTSGTKTKVKEIDLKATEDYKPAFSVAIVSQSGDTVKIDDYTKSYTMEGYVNMPTIATVILTPATNNVAQTLPANAWTKNVATPFTFEYGAGATLLTDAKLTYTPAAEGSQTATLQLTASYTDATPQQVDSTITITLTGNAQKSLSTLAFKPNLMTATGDSIFQSQSIDALFEILGNTKPITFTFNGEANSDLVTIEPYKGNYRLVAHDVAGVDEPQLITIVATQEPDDAMLGKTITIKLTVLPQVAWNWGTLYFNSTTTTKPVITYSNESWNLSVVSNPNHLIQSLATDPTNGYVATIGTPADTTQTYTATFNFIQGSYTKIFTSTIYADPRILPYCVDNDITYNDVTLGVATKSVTYNSGTITFASTATATSTWVIEMSGVPDMLSFTPTVTEKAWRVEEFNGEYWSTIMPWNTLTQNQQYELSLSPNAKQLRFTYAAGDGGVGKLSNVCITALDAVKSSKNKVYIPIRKDADDNVVATTQKVVLYSVVNKELTLSLSSNDLSLNVETLPAKTGAYLRQEVTITNNGTSEEIINLYVKDGATTLLTLPICPFEFRQGLPIDLANDDEERYHLLTTASATDTWADSTINVTWDASNKVIAFENPDDINARRCVVIAYEGAADYIQFHTSINANRSEWIIQESEDGLGWRPAVDSLKTVINGNKGIRQELDYTTRYVRISYRTNNLSRVLITNVKIEGTPHLIVNPERMYFTDDSEQTKMGLLKLTTINLEEIRVVSNDTANFKILYDETDFTKQVNEFTATANKYPHALGRNKVGDVMLGVAWQGLHTIDDATLTIYNEDSVLAVVSLLGTKGLLTLDNADETSVSTGISRDYTYHGDPYNDYKYHKVNLTNTFAGETAVFDYLFIYGETTPAEGYDITAPLKGSANGSTNIGSNAVTPLYVYKRVPNAEGKYVGYQFVDKIDNVNVSNKSVVGDVIVEDTADVVYIDVRNKNLSVYMTGFCPYATTGYDKLQEGVFLFRGTHGDSLDIYLEDFHVLSRNKTEHGNAFYGDKEGGETYSDSYARGSGGVLVFENVDAQEQLQNYQPFVVSIHSRGDNLLNSNHGCFFALKIGDQTAMKATQVSSPIQVHMVTKDHVNKTKTTLNFDDIWPTVVDANNLVVDSCRTNGFLALKKQANNAPSIDLGNPYTEVNFKGGRIELQNSQIGSDTYKTTLAISYRAGFFGSEDADIWLCHGIGTDAVDGVVNFLDGTVTVERMKVAAAYRQYYLMDTLPDGSESEYTSCLRTPRNTFVRGGSICRIRACQNVTSKGGGPRDKSTGSLLGQYVYKLQPNDELYDNGLVKSISFPDTIAGLFEYQSSRNYTYGLNSVAPDGAGNLYFWIPDGFGGVTAEKDVFMTTWKACMTKIGAGVPSVAEGTIGGDIRISSEEEVRNFLYCQLDQNIYDVINEGPMVEGKKTYTYKAPIEVPAAAKDFFDGAYTRWSPNLVGEEKEHEVLSDSCYTITNKVYYITTATADIWKTFTAPFNVKNIYVVETYSEAELEDLAKEIEIANTNTDAEYINPREAVLKEQAKHNADFAAFFGVAMAMGTMKDFDAIYDSYIKWAKIEDDSLGLYIKGSEYSVRGKYELTPLTINSIDSIDTQHKDTITNWDSANFFLYRNAGNWKISGDEMDHQELSTKWEMLKTSEVTDILLRKGETYSMLFPYCVGCETSIEERGYWDYWSGKFLIFEGVDAPQTINGRNFLDTVAANIATAGEVEEDGVVVTGNSTFAFLNVYDENVFTYEAGDFYGDENFIQKGDDSLVSVITPTTAFLYGYVPTNAEGAQAYLISRTGQIKYRPTSEGGGDDLGTGGHVPTINGGSDIFVTSIADGINIAVAEPQYVGVFAANGTLLFNGWVEKSVNVALVNKGVYVVVGENVSVKVIY